MQINLKPIGVIKKSGKNSEILIYSEFEQVIRNMLSRTGKTEVEGNDVLESIKVTRRMAISYRFPKQLSLKGQVIY